MTTRRALVTGASIAGLSAAFWLHRTGWQVTVLERAETFRQGGQNIDIRGVAHDVLDRMDLTDTVRAHHTTETGTVLVDADGQVSVELPSEGPDGATAELEVLRGDLAMAIRDRLPDGVELVYGDSVVSVDEKRDVVRVGLRSGRVVETDLLVVAEGVRSTTRDLVFGEAVHRDELGITMAFGTIPRTPGDDDRWRWYTALGGRQVHLRPDNHGTTRAILAYADTGSEEQGGADDLVDLGHDEAVQRLRERFADAGWQAPRVLDGFAGSDDVYVDRLARVEMATWHRGRVCLAGDAAWCVTPLGGGGASLALTSGYVLAACLSGARGPEDDGRAGLQAALAAYEDWMRPVVEDVAKLPPGLRGVAYPQTGLGRGVRDLALKALTSRPLRSVTEGLMSATADHPPLPDLVEAS